MEDFLGTPVKISFNKPDIHSACGIISEIRAETQLLTIKNAIVIFKGEFIEIPLYNIYGHIIKDIEMISLNDLHIAASNPSLIRNADITNNTYYSDLALSSTPLKQSSKKNSPGSIKSSKKASRHIEPTNHPTTPINQSSDNKSSLYKYNDPALLVINTTRLVPEEGADQYSALQNSQDSSYCPPQTAQNFINSVKSSNINNTNANIHAQSRNSAVSQQTPNSNPSSTKKKSNIFKASKATLQSDSNSWAAQDVAEYNANEFDFEANLKLFDKSKVFEDIRSKDVKDPKHLLVNINRLEKPRTDTNSLRSSNATLLNAAEQLNIAGKSNETSFSQAIKHNTAIIGSNTTAHNTSGSIKHNVPLDFIKSNPANSNSPTNQIKSVRNQNNRFIDLFVSPEQWAKMEFNLGRDVGIGESSLVEVAGKVASQVAVSLLKKNKASKRNQSSIILFVGNGRNGLYGLSTARYLLNIGYTVSVFLAFDQKENIYLISQYLNLVKICGGTILKSLSDLPKSTNFDLIVDSIFTPNDISMSSNQFSAKDPMDVNDISDITSLFYSKPAKNAAIWSSRQLKNVPSLALDFPSLSLLSAVSNNTPNSNYSQSLNANNIQNLLPDSIKTIHSNPLSPQLSNLAISSKNDNIKSKKNGQKQKQNSKSINVKSSREYDNSNNEKKFNDSADSSSSAYNLCSTGSGYSSDSDGDLSYNRSKNFRNNGKNPSHTNLFLNRTILSFGLPSSLLLKDALYIDKIIVADIGIPFSIWPKVLNCPNTLNPTVKSLFSGSDTQCISL
ncbi:Enhancer of mRNA-decapping protein 3 [Smittium culicis]|uniref:Enhancer of mRNA-decapping protein 3 n=1 Tax=Smittium culicis TaxID=133412 RepID=A0A1R1Y8G1_9FUNG|nr:Enhancer of mRNA-decapping protein 3 [Smittium culicis]